jgi:ADP-ribose pyrophosphatase YjhB (NUDIX family)
MYDYDKLKAKEIIVIAFGSDNKVLAIRDDSGVDILRGALTWEDDTWQHAALREAREEGNVTLGLISLAAVVQSRRKDAAEHQITHTLVVAARIKSIDPYQPWHGVPRRVFLSKEQLLRRFSDRRAKDLRKLFDMAEFVLEDDARQAADHARPSGR